MFKPHDFSPTFYGTPKIKITQSALEDMWHLVQVVPIEVGWFCVTHEEDDGTIVLSEVLLPGQECAGAETEFSIKGLEDLATQILEEDTAKGVDCEAPEFRYNHLNTWCHSHANMGVGPSGQDDRQMQEFCKYWGDDAFGFYVRGIFNKKGEIQFTVYYKCSKVWVPIKDCPWEVIGTADPTRRKFWEDAVKDKVNKRTYQTTYAGKGKHASAGKGGTVITRNGVVVDEDDHLITHGCYRPGQMARNRYRGKRH